MTSAYPAVISTSFNTVRQLRIVLVVASFESKYSFVSLDRPTPLGQRSGDTRAPQECDDFSSPRLAVSITNRYRTSLRIVRS